MEAQYAKKEGPERGLKSGCHKVPILGRLQAAKQSKSDGGLFKIKVRGERATELI